MDEIYRERAHLVAALSKLFPACIDPNPIEPNWPICFIDLPTGQVSWHIALSDMGLFAHLPKGERVWDRHTTEEKYARLDALKPSPEPLLEPYDWGPDGEPKGQPIRYVPGEGWKVGE